MPTGSERLIWAQGDGSTLTLTPSHLGRLATAICWENLVCALRLNFYAQGVDIRCAPTADARDVQLATLRHIAVERRCFVFAANQFARAEDLSPSLPTSHADPDEMVCGGASVIVKPCGDVLAGPLTDDEGLLVADLDPDDVTRGRYDFDAAGHYSRPDLCTLVVDRREGKPVVRGPVVNRVRPRLDPLTKLCCVGRWTDGVSRGVAGSDGQCELGEGDTESVPSWSFGGGLVVASA